MRRRICFIFALLLFVIPCANAQEDGTLLIEKTVVIARGRWSPTEQKPASESKPGAVRPRLKNAHSHLPLVEIHCYKVVDFCLQAQAGVEGGEPNLSVGYYKIKQWDKNAIVAEKEDSGCTTDQVRVSFKDGNVTATDSPKKQGKGGTCTTPTETASYELIGEGRPERSPAQ